MLGADSDAAAQQQLCLALVSRCCRTGGEREGGDLDLVCLALQRADCLVQRAPLVC